MFHLAISANLAIAEYSAQKMVWRFPLSAADEVVSNIRVDRVTQKGSVYDVVMAVSGCPQAWVTRTYTRVCRQYPESSSTEKVQWIRINGCGRVTPVANALTLIEIVYVLPGKAATTFRRSSAAMVCQMLGGDLTILAEVERCLTQMASTSEGAFLSGTIDQHAATKICVKSFLWDAPKFEELANKAAFEDLQGAVYLVTSPAVNLVKIGSWKGTMTDLRSRYVTYYGQDLYMWAFQAEDCDATERACHRALAAYRISNELFKPDLVDEYLTTIKGLCEGCLVCPQSL